MRATRRPGTTMLLGHAPWSARAWRVTAHVLVGGVLGVFSGGLVLALTLLTAALAVTVVFGLGSLQALVGCVHGFAALQRSRFDAFLGATIAPPTAPQSGAGARRWLAEARSESTRRQLGYHLFALVVDGAGAVLLAFAWAGGALLLATPLWNHTVTSLALAGVGVVLLGAAPWLATGVAAADLRAGRALLGPSPSAELKLRVASLSRSRADLIEAADTERRRIERDLHDGMQQRLVTLAMNLGLIRAAFPDAPDPLRAAITQSHEEAKQALAELRGVVRGLYPAVLDDRGLDAALSGIAARSPVPVRVRVDLPSRPPKPVEAVAYFVVSEALTNVAKHAAASRVELDVRLLDGGARLRVMVADDGRGGARAEGGTGLLGLAQRVASVDGRLDIDSPAGGPTTITVELPCGS